MNLRSIHRGMWYLYAVEYYWTLKRKGIVPHATTWMKFENKMLSEINQKVAVWFIVCDVTRLVRTTETKENDGDIEGYGWEETFTTSWLAPKVQLSGQEPYFQPFPIPAAAPQTARKFLELSSSFLGVTSFLSSSLLWSSKAQWVVTSPGKNSLHHHPPCFRTSWCILLITCVPSRNSHHTAQTSSCLYSATLGSRKAERTLFSAPGTGLLLNLLNE